MHASLPFTVLKLQGTGGGITEQATEVVHASLPFTVLTLIMLIAFLDNGIESAVVHASLPFTVLKHFYVNYSTNFKVNMQSRACLLTVYGFETIIYYCSDSWT